MFEPVLNMQLYLLEIILPICGQLDTTVMNIFGKVKISHKKFPWPHIFILPCNL